jgi:UDP-N-acetylmuramate--alanine ligase
VGVAGVGMSAVAQVLAARGLRVTGSDRFHDRGRQADVVRCLRAAGIELVPQDGSGVCASTREVVVSTAIEPDNPDLAAARRLGVPVRHRSAVLAAMTAGRPCVAVGGTSGKSTVTGMIGWMLECLGRDPAVVNGAPVLNWRTSTVLGNVRLPAGGGGTARTWWIVEADESDRSLLNLSPSWAVVNNVSADHFDARETRRVFDAFLARAREGTLDMTRETLPPVKVAEMGGGGSRFVYDGQLFALRMPGRHNIDNAVCALEMCRRLGAGLPELAPALETFRGLHRRLELVGVSRGVRVYDDYAHNPAKLSAAWETLGMHGERVLGLWRPHGYGALRKMRTELAAALERTLRPGDRLWVLPVYDAGGTADRSMNSDALVARLRSGGLRGVDLAADLAAGVEALAAEARGGDVAAVMGARDPDLPAAAREVLRRLGTAP